MKEIIIDGELSCNNCLEKTRCKQQQKTNKQRIDALLSYIIASEDNETYIAELKNEIPAITRCDVVLEKQLKLLEQELKVEKQDKKYIKECCIRAGKELSKHSFEWDGKEKNLVVQAMQLNEDYERLEQENKELKEENESLNYQWQKRIEICDAWIKVAENYKQALEEIREIVKEEQSDIKQIYNRNNYTRMVKIQKLINEVLK